MDINFITATLDKYGLSDRFDAKQVLLKMGGRRPGKHCVGKSGGKGSYISAEKQCASHKGTDGKLTAAGKQSARELAARVRDRKGMGTQMETRIGRMPMRDFIAGIKGKPTEKIIAPQLRKAHKEARSELNKRRIKGGRSAIVDKKAPRTPKASDRSEAKTPTRIDPKQQSNYAMMLSSVGNGFPNNPKFIKAWADKHEVALDQLIANHGAGLTPKAAKNNSPEFLALTKAIYNDKPFAFKGKKTKNMGIGESLSKFIN